MHAGEANLQWLGILFEGRPKLLQVRSLLELVPCVGADNPAPTTPRS
jgi:hypothetical protein